MTVRRMKAKRVISLLLTITMLFTLLSGCSTKVDSDNQDCSNSNMKEIVETTAKDIIENMDDYTNENKNEFPLMSYSWEDYKGDVETFAYGVLVNDMQYAYDVFPAYVELKDGTTVTGIGYTDYSTGYTNEEETVAYFEAGFIANSGETRIPEADIQEGLAVNSLDYEDESTSFVMTYQADEFIGHCVVYDQYVKYGIDSEDCFFYEAVGYEREICDESLGSLYSYDEGKYLYDLEVGDYVGVTGETLSSLINFAEYEKEINSILETQDTNFVQVDIESYAYFSQEAVRNYLLSMQEETFMGYSVDALVEATRELEPMECYRITKDGLVTIDLEHSTGEQIAQWLVGTACVITVATGMVASMVFTECPPLSACSSAIVGVAVEVFMQVVISGQTVSDVDWCKVGVAACAGAVSGLLGPYISATTSGVTLFLSDSVIDGMIGGVEQVVYSWMEDPDGKDMISRFGSGFVMGFALSAGFKGISAAFGKIVNKVAPHTEKLATTLIPKLSKKVSGDTSKISSNVAEGIYKLKDIADGSVFHSQYISNKISTNQLARLVDDGNSELQKKAFDNLAKNNMFDENGNQITKKTLEDLFESADDNTVIAYFKIGEDIVNIKKQNGIVGIVFDEIKFQTVTLPNGIGNNRDANFLAAAKIYKEEWIKDPTKIPTSISEAIDATGKPLSKLEEKKIKSIVQNSSNGWVFHENIDMKTITLVPRSLHNTNSGGVSHMGGYALAKYLKTHMAIEFFDRLKNAASSTVAQGI